MSGGGYDELPENKFDPSDRKFLAVAVVAKAVVLNATDSDWHEHKDLMDKVRGESGAALSAGTPSRIADGTLSSC